MFITHYVYTWAPMLCIILCTTFVLTVLQRAIRHCLGMLVTSQRSYVWKVIIRQDLIKTCIACNCITLVFHACQTNILPIPAINWLPRKLIYSYIISSLTIDSKSPNNIRTSINI